VTIVRSVGAGGVDDARGGVVCRVVNRGSTMSDTQGNAHDDEVEDDADDREHAVECGVLGVAAKQVDGEKCDAGDGVDCPRFDDHDDNGEKGLLPRKAGNFFRGEPNAEGDQRRANNVRREGEGEKRRDPCRECNCKDVAAAEDCTVVDDTNASD